jgi:peptidoglycan/xylan/chitin deacetylase (PgdA/CDA1 family)
VAGQTERRANNACLAPRARPSEIALKNLARAVLKRPVERALASAAVTALTRRRLRGKTLILAYHGVIPARDRDCRAGERALFVSQKQFAAQLDVLAETAHVVPLDRIDTPGAGTDRPIVAITFDDAYQGAVTCAMDELQSRGMSATIFVAPGCLGGRTFWWDALAHHTGEIPAGVRAYALDALAGSDTAVREWAGKSHMTIHDDLPSFARSATRDELLSAAARPGISIGSHTWSHVNVARLGDADLSEEFARSREWLRAEVGGKFIPWLAYPYGLESERARHAARESGYEFALRIDGGWHAAGDVPHLARPRLNIGAGMSINGFRARVLGSWRA